jgi:single-stranded-DNA-specific exonuclease
MPPAAPSIANWVTHPRRSEERARSLAAALDAPLAMAHALVNRGLDTEERARRFLEPALENLHDPRHMLGLEAGAERILAAIERGERISIQGDYDVDGITSTFLLYSVIKDLGGQAEYRIPNRTKDGYGVTAKAMEEAHARRCTLVVTVDNGITANEAVTRGRELGIDTVITDHHEPPAVLPDAVAIINPLQPGCSYPFKSLAGVGVAFKLVEVLLRGRGGIDRASTYLDVVALGTIADVVPLVGENRILARVGLEQLNRGARLGLQALIKVAKLSEKRITSGHVAFVLAPRINASGRVGNAEQGLRLLLASQEGEAEACANGLEDDNKRRRELDSKALREASAQFENELAREPDRCSILLWSEDWNPGVIGIVASRLVERFRRPAVLVGYEAERKDWRGSGRSLPGLDLTRLLDGCTDLLLTHGGHAFAAGLSVNPDNLSALRDRFEELVRREYHPERFTPRIEVDDDLPLSGCTPELVDWLERMAPHGLDNPEPQFQMLGARVERVVQVGNKQHLRFNVCGDGRQIEAIGFGMGDQADALRRAGRADLVFHPTRNEWNDEVRVQLKLKSLRLA